MHLTYDIDEKSLQSGTRQKVISNTLSMFRIEDQEGELLFRGGQTNVFVYVDSNPINYFYPSGLQPPPWEPEDDCKGGNCIDFGACFDSCMYSGGTQEWCDIGLKAACEARKPYDPSGRVEAFCEMADNLGDAAYCAAKCTIEKSRRREVKEPEEKPNDSSPGTPNNYCDNVVY